MSAAPAVQSATGESPDHATNVASERNMYRESAGAVMRTRNECRKLIRNRACIAYTSTTKDVMLNLLDGTYNGKDDNAERRIVTRKLKAIMKGLPIKLRQFEYIVKRLQTDGILLDYHRENEQITYRPPTPLWHFRILINMRKDDQEFAVQKVIKILDDAGLLQWEENCCDVEAQVTIVLNYFGLLRQRPVLQINGGGKSAEFTISKLNESHFEQRFQEHAGGPDQ